LEGCFPDSRRTSSSSSDTHCPAFTVGDPLLCGVAEPLRRMLRTLLERQGVLSERAEQTPAA
jgi:hypothetical protein